ncbi:hypothetical protein [Streptomyces sp. NPDC008150]|uniref:hypothetical protein n=1 Tax=Streptomyces sp. NPDC008150 TaxID=3364816 RepID=UPI0036E21C6E
MADVTSGAGTTGDDKARTTDDKARRAADRTTDTGTTDPAVDGGAYTSAVRDGYGVTDGTDDTDEGTTGRRDTTGRADTARERSGVRGDDTATGRTGTGTSGSDRSTASDDRGGRTGSGESVVDEAKRRAATTGSDRATDTSADTGRTRTGTAGGTTTGTGVGTDSTDGTAKGHAVRSGIGAGTDEGDALAAKTRATTPAAPGHKPSGTASTSTSTGTGTGKSGSGLLGHDDGDKFALRLQQAVTGFVDGPRDAVEEADHVLEEVAARFTDAVTERRRSLRTSWESGSKGGDTSSSEADTEKLRLALKDYRELTERLLHL